MNGSFCPALNIAFRVDSSIQIGSGHLMRCLTLADSLRDRGAKVTFICRELSCSLIGLVYARGFQLLSLPPPPPNTTSVFDNGHASWLGVPWQSDSDEVIAQLEKLPRQDWLIIDHYALDLHWESLMRPYVGKIMVIDDLADRNHDCDLLLDQNLYDDMESRYTGLTPQYCRTLLGPRFALLRPEFVAARNKLRKRDGFVRRILVFFGGSDPSNETAKALQAILSLDRPDIAVDVVVGGANPHKHEIESRCSGLANVSYHCQVDNMAELMSEADLAVGAGGTATWERCCLGLPALVLVVARNQAEVTMAVARSRAIINMGWHDSIYSDNLAFELRSLIADPALLVEIGRNALELMGDNSQECLLDILLTGGLGGVST